MQGAYNVWLVAVSYAVAVAACFAALEFGGRVVSARGRTVWAWMAGGSLSIGVGIWSMHFIGMLAFHLPIALSYDAGITVWSAAPAILCAAMVLELVRQGGLHGWRLASAATLLGTGIAGMHYTGMAAIPIAPAISYQPAWFLTSIAVAIAMAYIALKLAFSLSHTARAPAMKMLATFVMGGAVAAMHYTGMAAARFAPDAICTVAPGTIDNMWLAVVIAFSTGLILICTIAILTFDARFAQENAGIVAALQQANAELARYQADQEEEKRVARQLVERITSVSHDLQGQVGSWVLPAQYFSGDLVAFARTPAKTLHVLLGDGTGHGLAAALSALPVVQPFCSMTEMGYSLSTIAREINNKIRETLPVGRFVAAAIASIDPRTGTITVWNGGNPLCCLLDATGKVRQRFRSAHVPLGILDDAGFDAELEAADYDEACQLFIASDGLLEAENDMGVPFGEARALQVVADVLPALRLPALRSAIQSHLGAKMASDDISIVMVNCDQLPAAKTQSPTIRASGAELSNDAT